ncbi:MAG: hypothetical protein IIC22_07640, partial [Chloroflexi bacterium]|nr:hypothetical protein [Chloroflexota bacterium]
MKVELFIPEYVADSAIAGLNDRVLSIEGVRQVEYVSREEVLARFKERRKNDQLILQALEELG